MKLLLVRFSFSFKGLPGVTNRRARTPLWSYHFYPEEVHTDLVLHLPSAVLLKEVQLQPHAGSLATSPSYVALEVMLCFLA